MTTTITTSRTDKDGRAGKVEINYQTGAFSIEDVAGAFKLHKTPNAVYTVQDEKGRSWTGFNDGEMACFAYRGVTREHRVPQVAFARVMWNL